MKVHPVLTQIGDEPDVTEPAFDRMEVRSPEVLATPPGPLARLLESAERRGVVMLSDDTPEVPLDRKEMARQYLRMENAIDQYSRQHRPYFARLAREEGLTHQDIADEYGISEAAVRGLLKRDGGAPR